MQPTFTFLNNDFFPDEKAFVPASDLAVQRGYGIFDFLRVADNRPLFLEAHLERFYQSARHMRLPVPYGKDELKDILHRLIHKNAQPSSGIRITLTGGPSPDGYAIAVPNLVISQKPLQLPGSEAFEKGIRLVTYEHQRQLPHVKTIDYLMAVWLQAWIREQGADDVLYHHQGSITECPRANFFLVMPGNEVLTPANHILKGITRMHLLAARQPYTVTEKEVTLRDLEVATEAFITSSTKGVLPVTQVNGRPLHGGRPGPVTTCLQQALATFY